MTFYRPTRTPSTGGQTNVSWPAIFQSVRYELHALPAETLRLVFGIDSRVELVAFAAVNTDIRELDGIVVTAGAYTGSRFRVLKTRRSRKYLEVGLTSTDEVFP